uniref:RNA helicase n=1 Tax=Timspurckia oligopyrenoides TaxID=708627 RepID=A0A7S0ZF31_9RHOD|mmetsp:Transcript_2867/g.5038  ORF Transcript_2867/g.5038 Transcript_2867/m.5038 type:complete len:498 (+) Transcript_2867:60-1553(+)
MNGGEASVTSELANELQEKATTGGGSEETSKVQESKPQQKAWADISSDEDESNPVLNKANNDDVVDVSGIDPGDKSADVQVLQADPSTPYYSATSFEELNLSESLLRGIYANKFNKPSKIQATSLPMILGKDAKGLYKNLVGQAHNGSGKTACFVLGMLSRIDDSCNEVQSICVVPTRELARQIQEVVETLGKFTKVKVYLAVKQSDEERKNWRDQNEPTSRNITQQVVIGTPGKLLDLIKKRSIDTKKVKVFVLDEADVMVDTQGMGDQTLRIKRTLPRDVQTLLFSATYADEVRELALKIAPDANQITVKREQLSLDSIKQYYFDCSKDGADGRFNVLSDIYSYLTIGQSIIFVRTRAAASELSTRMRAEGHTVSLLYGGEMTPEERDRVIDEFRSATTKVLITTNVLARGVDILQVTVVINYDLPTDHTGTQADPETYLHRIGRTGRFGRKGVAINFVHDAASRSVLAELERYYGRPTTKVEDVEELERRIQEL